MLVEVAVPVPRGVEGTDGIPVEGAEGVPGNPREPVELLIVVECLLFK